MSDFPKKINATPDTVINGYSNEVALMVNGTPFRLWDDLEITRSFDTVADTFSLICPFNPEIKRTRQTFQPFKYQECGVYIGGEKVLTGNIINIEATSNANSRVLKIDGYSKPGILNDCSVPPTSWPVSINGLNLKEIADRLCKDYGIIVMFEGSPGAKFSARDKIEIESDKKIIDFLIDIAKLRGFLISSNVDGKLLFRKTPVGMATVKLEEGKNPLLSATCSFKGQSRYSHVTLLKSNNRFGAGQSTTVEDEELKKNAIVRHNISNAEDTEMGNLKTAALARMGRIIADSINLSCSLSGWRRYDNGALWKAGDLVDFFSMGNMIYKNTTFLVRDVKFIKKSDSLTCDLSLVLPEAYSGAIRKVFPWAS